jgi:hypothetical protein
LDPYLAADHEPDSGNPRRSTVSSPGHASSAVPPSITFVLDAYFGTIAGDKEPTRSAGPRAGCPDGSTAHRDQVSLMDHREPTFPVARVTGMPSFSDTEEVTGSNPVRPTSVGRAFFVCISWTDRPGMAPCVAGHVALPAAPHALRVRLPQILTGVTRMKCAGTVSIHGSSPASLNGTRSASASR